MKRWCLNCHKEFAPSDPRQKFCSNFGAGNCKDAFHNAKGPRRRMKHATTQDYSKGRPNAMRPYHEVKASATFDPDAWMDDLECEDPGDDMYYGGKDDAWFH